MNYKKILLSLVLMTSFTTTKPTYNLFAIDEDGAADIIAFGSIFFCIPWVLWSMEPDNTTQEHNTTQESNTTHEHED